MTLHEMFDDMTTEMWDAKKKAMVAEKKNKEQLAIKKKKKHVLEKEMTKDMVA
jgi:hypothetical protein